MNTNELVPRLMSEFGYPPAGAELVASKLINLTSPLDEAFLTWWTSGSMPELEIEGYSVQRLSDEHHMKPIAAFLTLDWLNREPRKAHASLKRGHDHVNINRSR